MKNGYMKKSFSLLLCLSMVCAMLLTGCGGSKDKGLEGDWEGAIDFTDEMKAQLPAEAMDYIKIDDFGMTIQLSLKDGKFTLGIDEKSVEDSMSKLIDSVKDGVKDYLEDTIKAQGIDMSVDEYCQAMAGMSYDDYFDTAMAQSLNMDAMMDQFSDMEVSGTYKEDGDTLILTDENGEEEELTFKLDGDKLTLDSDMDKDFGFEMFPLEMERQ